MSIDTTKQIKSVTYNGTEIPLVSSGDTSSSEKTYYVKIINNSSSASFLATLPNIGNESIEDKEIAAGEYFVSQQKYLISDILQDSYVYVDYSSVDKSSNVTVGIIFENDIFNIDCACT